MSTDVRPWVAAAAICEHVLQEKDDVNSLIRVVDTVVLQSQEMPEGVEAKLGGLTLYISLKSGDLRGEDEVSVALHRPDGRDVETKTWPVAFRGGETGVNLAVRFEIGEPGEGIYWFDVLWRGELLTRVPLRIRLAEQSTSREG